MKSIKKQMLLMALVLLSSIALQAQSLTSTLDNLLNENYPPELPGATVLVAEKGKVIYRKAFGMANLELDVAMRPEHVFEIGSITKQFTTVSILMLMEEGKLSLTDEITKFMPDYPTNGKKITVHHLMNHTSGIKSYTEMQSFFSRAREDMSPTELIDVFKNEPMDFDPGEQYHYNNSAYIILGHIIEVVSEKTYAEFIEERIFEPLKMKDSYYGSHSTIIKNRADGYQPTENGYRNADYLSLTLPYAAGSIMSNVDDMLKWQQALHNNTLISEKSKQLAFTNYKLNDGKPIYYGYGFSVDEVNGTPSIEHGGGIFGYETYAIYVPSKDLYAVILTNKNGRGPTDITIEVAAHALGTPYAKTSQKKVSEKEMKQWVGTYQFDNDVIRYITFQDGSLYSEREGSQNLKLNALGNDEFAFEDSFTTYAFRTENGKKVALFKSRIREGKGVETDKARPAEKQAITLAPDILKRYEGTYELQPGFEIEITTQGNQIFAEATGQGQFEIFAEDETTFFLKVVSAQIVFTTNNQGIAESLTLYQGGQEMPGKKKN
ncbi:serine hydrolase [Aureisphaera galaxeae]|uniref:serine hydrolase n=1 Tax=Aureisphaera galaxeae TaxID=1538023 RepID=UPI002350026A|nr:serine hydrolase [Aureisphaera galaxeae]MDC8003369.1 serine hydrolase [Aureisphaera galaxeae]